MSSNSGIMGAGDAAPKSAAQSLTLRLYILRSDLPGIAEQLRESCRFYIFVWCKDLPCRIFTSEETTRISGARLGIQLRNARIVNTSITGQRKYIDFDSLSPLREVELHITNTDRRKILEYLRIRKYGAIAT